MLQKIRFFDKKNPQNYRYQNYCPGWQEFKSFHVAFYVNPSWACALLRNNKQHVVLGQKRKCQRVEESGLWRIQRERWIEVKYLPNGTNAGLKEVLRVQTQLFYIEKTTFRSVFANNSVFNLHFMKVSTENGNNVGYENNYDFGRQYAFK